jgi:biopolymer transport protein ExbD
MRNVRATSIKPMAGTDLTTFSLTFVVMSVLLLVIFSTASTMICHGVSIDLPKVGHARPMRHAEREDALLVGIMRTGDVFFGNDKVARDALSGKMLERLRGVGGERKVYIRADGRANGAGSGRSSIRYAPPACGKWDC